MNRKVVMAMCAATAALTVMGCEKKQSAETSPAQQAAPAESAKQAAPAATAFSAAIPSTIPKKAITAGGKANAELINGKKATGNVLEVKKGEGLTIEGWALSDTTKSVPETVAIELVPANGGAKYYAPANRIPRVRNDVADFFKEPAYKKSGYKATADLSSVPAGEYELIILQVIDGTPSRAYPGKKLKIVD